MARADMKLCCVGIKHGAVVITKMGYTVPRKDHCLIWITMDNYGFNYGYLIDTKF